MLPSHHIGFAIQQAFTYPGAASQLHNETEQNVHLTKRVSTKGSSPELALFLT